MDSKIVFTKTAKGLMEAAGKTRAVSRALRALLNEIDGKLTLAELKARSRSMSQTKLDELLQTLVDGDFIREFSRATPSAMPAQESAEPEMDLDFTRFPG